MIISSRSTQLKKVFLYRMDGEWFGRWEPTPAYHVGMTPDKDYVIGKGATHEAALWDTIAASVARIKARRINPPIEKRGYYRTAKQARKAVLEEQQ